MSTEDTCSICLNTCTEEIGVPDKCNHKFCKSCLKTWAQKRQICPLDRIPFFKIIVFENIESYTQVLEFLERSQKISNLFCAICGYMAGEEPMRQCMLCGTCFHDECLSYKGCHPYWKNQIDQIKIVSHIFCCRYFSHLSEIQAMVFHPDMDIDDDDEEYEELSEEEPVDEMEVTEQNTEDPDEEDEDTEEISDVEVENLNDDTEDEL